MNHLSYRRLANFQKEEEPDLSDSHIVKFNKAETAAAANYSRSAFYKKAPRPRIDYLAVDTCAFESMQSAALALAPHASFPVVVHRSGGNGRLSIR